MGIDTPDLMEYFLDFSVVVTGFSRFDLLGTGQADCYYQTVEEKIGKPILKELLDTFHGLELTAQKKYQPSILTEGLHSEILASGKLGPIARNIIKLWYTATWYELPDQSGKDFGVTLVDNSTCIPSPQAYPEGLVWRAVGVNPPGAKAPGYGTWSEEPSVKLTTTNRTQQMQSELEYNKELVRRAYIDGMNNRDLSVIDEVFAPDYVVYYPGFEPIKVEGRDQAKKSIQAFLDAFPDIVFEIVEQIAEGDKVATRWIGTGTNTGVFKDFPEQGSPPIPATGRPVRFSATDIYQIVDKKIKTEWNTLETMEILHQLGIVSAPG